MVGELRAIRIARFLAHRAIEAIERQKGEGIGANKLAHSFEVMRGSEKLISFGRIDAVIIRMGNRR